MAVTVAFNFNEDIRKAPHHFYGLSTDTKPTVASHPDMPEPTIGSTFFEHDTGAMYVTHDGTNWVLDASRYVPDDIALSFGTGGTVKLLYETADANANALLLVFPEGGAVDVPVFALGDASILNVDMGFFNGITEPTLAVVNDAADAYVSLDAGDDAVAGSKGLYFKTAADEDVELLNMSLTGTPRIYWDESEDQFRSTKGWVFDALCDVQGVWVATATWTLPPFTLGGTVTLNGKDMDAGAADLRILTTGNAGLYIKATNDTASGVLITTLHLTTTPADGDYIFHLVTYGRNDASPTPEDIAYGNMYIRSSDITDGTEDGQILLTVMAAGVADAKEWQFNPTGFFVTPNGVTVGASQGASFGPGGVTSITVVGGVVTAIS